VVTALLYNVLFETARTLYLAAPFLLLGLLLAGLLHVLLPAQLVQRFLGRPGMGGVVTAALVGVPLPVCSCGVVPLAVEMRRKGASQPASLSFLTTTPESSLDSILLTWGLMGPVMAVARPIAAFFTAVLGGLGAMLVLSEGEEDVEPAAAVCDHCAVGDPHPHPSDDATETGRGRGLWRGLLKPALAYGFVEMLDDLAFWLLIGVFAAGVLGALVPADLAALGLGVGLLPMLLVLAVGVPIYMCASASTPVAAALLAKGLSPGAALVFLLAGPATNAATVVLLGRTFGRRFVAVYLASVAAGAVAAGLALDALTAAFGWRLSSPLAAAGSPALALLEGLSFAVLVVLLAWRLSAGAWRRGIAELRATFGRRRTSPAV